MIRSYTFLAVFTVFASMSLDVEGCSWVAKVPVISLSSPVTGVLEVLGLSSNLAARADYHWAPGADGVELIRGGQSPSIAKLRSFGTAYLIFDKGQVLGTRLKRVSSVELIEVDQQIGNPFKVSMAAFKLLDGKVIKGCTNQFSKWIRSKQQIVEDLGKRLKGHQALSFFLGRVHPKLSGTLVQGDGVAELVQSVIPSPRYPSSANYINWSHRMLSQHLVQTIKVGLMSKGETKIVEGGMHFADSRVHLPGPTQIEAGVALLNWLAKRSRP